MSCSYVDEFGAVIRMVLGGIFLLAAGLKWRTHSSVNPLLQAVGVTSPRLSVVSDGAIPLIEAVLGLWLIWGGQSEIPLCVAMFFLLSGTAVLIVARSRGYGGGCGCFGKIDNREVGLVQFGRNAILLIASGFVAVQVFADTCAAVLVPEMTPSLILTALLLLSASVVAYALLMKAEESLQRMSDSATGR